MDTVKFEDAYDSLVVRSLEKLRADVSNRLQEFTTLLRDQLGEMYAMAYELGRLHAVARCQKVCGAPAPAPAPEIDF